MEAKECIFCKIVRKELPSTVVYEDKLTLLFLDIAPLNHGHVLVIPKEHFSDMHEVPHDLLRVLISRVKDVADAMKSAFSCDGVNVFVNNGKAAGQLVFHLHFHVVPRYYDDGLDWSGWRRKSYRDSSEAKEIAEKIRAGLKLF